MIQNVLFIVLSWFKKFIAFVQGHLHFYDMVLSFLINILYFVLGVWTYCLNYLLTFFCKLSIEIKFEYGQNLSDNNCAVINMANCSQFISSLGIPPPPLFCFSYYGFYAPSSPSLSVPFFVASYHHLIIHWFSLAAFLFRVHFTFFFCGDEADSA